MRRMVMVSVTLILSIAAPRASAQVCGEVPKVLIVLDRSGSMKEEVAGKSKWAIAKTAVTSLGQQFSAQLALGLMLYPNSAKTAACATGKVDVAPSVGSDTKLLTALNSAFPAGNTPIAATLDKARSYFGSLTSEAHHVILVSDGKETCLSSKEPLSAPGSCSWDNGTNYRKCGGCGWQFCLSSGVWSSSCAPVPDLFTCVAGQTCGADALCKGTATGSATAKIAAKKLANKGVKTHVIGFGGKVNKSALDGIAAEGGTGGFLQANDLTQLISALQQIAASISCCGNGQLDAGESCDNQIPAGQPGACPSSCDDGDPCTADQLVGADCSVSCQSTPITTTIDDDGCCPVGAEPGTDSDCVASCGNGALDPGEGCDPKILSGQIGACDNINCDDGDPCTADAPTGHACNPHCGHQPIGPDPAGSDGCCPAGLTLDDDADCLPPCSPDVTENCVDTCDGVQCPDGHYCKWGQCIPWDASGGCDCRIGTTDQAQALGLSSLILALFLLLRRRRR